MKIKLLHRSWEHLVIIAVLLIAISLIPETTPEWVAELLNVVALLIIADWKRRLRRWQNSKWKNSEP